ncbi:MAG: cytochrome c, partial [Pseudomonadota bacterium]
MTRAGVFLAASCALSALIAACSEERAAEPAKIEAAAVAGAMAEEVDDAHSDIASGAALYADNCASCHGKSLEGALATALIKSDWMYGRDSFSITNNILNGIPSAGMPGFNDVLSEESVDAVFAFIMDAQTTPPGVGNPLPEELSTRSYR